MSLIEHRISGSKTRSAGSADWITPLQRATIALAAVSAGLLAWQSVDPAPFLVAGLCIDRVTALFGLLVSGVGATAMHYARRALDGDPARARFLALLAGAVAAAWVTATADSMPLMIAACVAQGMAVHGLLTIRSDRPQALLPSRTSFLCGRVGDMFLLAAFALAWRDWGTLSISTFVGTVASSDAGSPTSIAVLLALAAIAKSAQVPFHAWLPETMEAPTPVSALMHAGIVNAGGVLLIRFAPAMAQSPVACMLLALAGTATVVIGMPAMWAQVKAKRELAWSTVAQMGFMTVQCGLAAYPAVALHVVGHGCYKAWSFLRAGEMPAPSGPAPRFGRAIALIVAGAAGALPLIVATGSLLGMDVLHSPGECALAAVLAISTGQAWAAILGTDRGISLPRTALALVVLASMALLGPLAWFGMAAFLEPVIGTPALARTALGWATAAVPVIALVSLAVLHAGLPSLHRLPWGFAFHVHALNGFYLGTATERLVDAAWPTDARRGVGNAHPTHDAHA